MSPNPADRPSAREVLASDLLPTRLEDEQLKHLLRSLPDHPETYERVVDALFASAPGAGQQGAEVAGSGAAGLVPRTSLVQQQVGCWGWAAGDVLRIWMSSACLLCKQHGCMAGAGSEQAPCCLLRTAGHCWPLLAAAVGAVQQGRLCLHRDPLQPT
jgi:hypothetical protein